MLIAASFVNAAKARIQWLEGIIREHLPDIDLESGPRLISTAESSNTEHDSQALGEANLATPLPYVESSSSATGLSSLASQRGTRKRSLPAATAADHDEQFSEKAHSVAMNLGMLSLNSDSSQKHYIGSSSGLLFTHLIGVSPSTTDSPDMAEEPRAQPEWGLQGTANDFSSQQYRSLHIFLRQVRSLSVLLNHS